MSSLLRLASPNTDNPPATMAFGVVTFHGVDDGVLNLGHNAGITGRDDPTKVGWWMQLEHNFNASASGPILSEWFVQWTAADGDPVVRPLSCTMNWTTELAEVGLTGKVSHLSTAGVQRMILEESGRVVLQPNSELAYFWQAGHNQPVISGTLKDGVTVCELLRISSNVVDNEIYVDANQLAARVRVHSPGGVYIGLGGASTKAALEVDSTSRGLLPPRMTTTQRNNIATPPTGLELYNTTDDGPQVKRSGGWEQIITVSAPSADTGAMTSNGASADHALVDVATLGVADQAKINANFDDVADMLNDIRACLRAARLMA